MHIFNKFTLFCQNIVLIIWGCILYLLLFLSINNTSYNLEYVTDNYIINFITIILFLLIIVISAKFISKLKIPHFSSKSLALFTFGLGCVFIFGSQLAASSDGQKVLQIANEIQEYNYSAFVRGGYIDRYPHQTGLVLFYYIISLFLGNNNYFIIQFINVILFSLAVYYINEMYCTYLIRHEFEKSNILYLAYYSFIPIYSYLTFVYGTIPGFAFSIFAIYNMYQFIKAKRTTNMLFSCLYITLAIMLKTNSLIFWFAMLLFAAYFCLNEIIHKEKAIIKHTLFIAILLCCFFLGRNIPNLVMEQIIGIEISEGEPMSSYVVMGLMEAAVGPGSHNSYPADVYQNNAYDTAAAAVESNAQLVSLLKEYGADPVKAARFFLRKTAFQWNNPTFRCFTLMNGRSSVLKSSPLTELYSNNVFISVISTYLNIFTMIILFGSFLYLVINRKNVSLTDLFFAIVFIGGFLFHTFWESSPYYTFPYFLLLFPYAVNGYKFVQCNFTEKVVYKPLIAVFILLLIPSPVFSALEFGISRDTYNAKNDIVSETKEYSPIGMYYISPAQNPKLLLTTDTELYIGNHKVELKCDDTTVDYHVSIYPNNDAYTLRFFSLGNLLSVDEKNGELLAYYDDYKSLYYVPCENINSEWELIPANNENTYYILIDNAALTYDATKQQVILESFSSSESQEWVFIR